MINFTRSLTVQVGFEASYSANLFLPYCAAHRYISVCVCAFILLRRVKVWKRCHYNNSFSDDLTHLWMTIFGAVEIRRGIVADPCIECILVWCRYDRVKPRIMAYKHQEDTWPNEMMQLNSLKANVMSAKRVRPWAKSAKYSNFQVICQSCQEKSRKGDHSATFPWKKGWASRHKSLAPKACQELCNGFWGATSIRL